MDIELAYKEEFARAKAHNQEHIFAFFQTLKKEEKQNLLTQVQKIDYNFLEELYAKTKEKEPVQNITFSPPKSFDKYEQSPLIEQARMLGNQAIAQGKLALFIVAGGQGSRLGFSGPKGCYPITPVKEKTFFQVYCEKVLANQKKYDVLLEVYIMTSSTNDNETRAFFKKHNFFGLRENQVTFFIQDMIPSLDKAGKLLLETSSKVFENPNGHGGIYDALVKHGITANMKEKGITYLSFINIDNVLVDPFDPVYFGLTLLEDAQVATKVVEKNAPDEKVGLVVNDEEGKTRIVEYVNVSESLTTQKNEDGRLTFSAGNLNILLLRHDFIESIAKETKFAYLVQKKKIPYLDVSTKKIITPEENNGFKFERLVFDAFPFANTVCVVYTKRELEFAPVKEKTGIDSVESAKQMQTDLYMSWLINAGYRKDDLSDFLAIEISPLFALDEINCIEQIKRDKQAIDEQLQKSKASKHLYLE